jgi:hypothetical protein
MLAAVTANASHPAVAVLLGLGAAWLAGVVVAMAWSVHSRQIRLAEVLARRQFIVTSGESEQARAEAQAPATVNGNGAHGTAAEAGRAGRARPAPLTIEGPETVVAGEQVRYCVRPSGHGTVVTWGAGGGAVSQSPDPAHPDQLLLIADRPGNLTITARVREGLTERRETKAVTALPDLTDTSPPFTLRLFLHGWGLVVVAVVTVGFAGALDALGDLASSDFIALVAPLSALVAVLAVVLGNGDASARPGKGSARPKP